MTGARSKTVMQLAGAARPQLITTVGAPVGADLGLQQTRRAVRASQLKVLKSDAGEGGRGARSGRGGAGIARRVVRRRLARGAGRMEIGGGAPASEELTGSQMPVRRFWRTKLVMKRNADRSRTSSAAFFWLCQADFGTARRSA